MKFLQEQEEEPNDMQRRINQLIAVQQMREDVYNKSQHFQDKIKNVFYKKTKYDDFQVQDVVLKWDSRFEDKGKHGKFDHLWKGPYKIAFCHGNNAFILQELNGDFIEGGPINGRFLKHHLT